MEYLDILKNRSTTFSWTTEMIPDDVLLEVCEEVHLYCPSKNKKIPYVVHIVENTEQEQRKAIHLACHRNTDKSTAEDGGNPQVLAPTLIAFVKREVEEAETRYQTIEKRDELGTANTDNIEIGMVAVTFLNALTRRGWDTGLCQCIRDRDGLGALLGLGGPIDLFIGVGRRELESTEGAVTEKVSDEFHWPAYRDPRDDLMKKIPYPYGMNPYPKPEFNDVYKIKK